MSYLYLTLHHILFTFASSANHILIRGCKCHHQTAVLPFLIFALSSRAIVVNAMEHIV